MLTLRAKPIVGAIIAAAVAVSTVWGPPSLAAPVHHLRHNYLAPPPPAAEARYATVPPPPVAMASACVPMCVTDYIPCDPVYFKLADGRCDGRIW